MRRVGLRIPSNLWSRVTAFGQAAAFVRPDGKLDVSASVRDLIERGLVIDRTREAGYRSGYREGRAAGFAAVMAAMYSATGRGGSVK